MVNKPLIFRCVLLSLICVITALQPISVEAQSLSQIKVSEPDVAYYPEISFSFWPFDSEGKFVSTITTSSLYVFENDKRVEINSLQLMEPGTHFILAVNESGTLGNSYAGESRLNRMKTVWADWAVDQAITTLDDFTLINNGGVLNDQLTQPAQWVDAIESYNPELESAIPSFACLTLALNKLSEITDSKTSAVLLITPLPGTDQLAGLRDLTTRAADLDIHVFVWLVGPIQYASEPGADVLREMAESTHGEFLLFSGAEELPPLSTYLDPLRLEYVVSYTTSVQTSGSYTLEIQVDQQGFQERSEKQNFDLTILPPNPILLSPPVTITRSWIQNEENRTWSLDPVQQPLQFMVEFPDGHTRLLNNAVLLVDREVVAENTTEPFTNFTWSLSPYIQSGSHLIQVRVEDEAGLTASTIEMPVSIIVNEKPLGFIGRFIKQVGLQTLGVAFFLILVAAGMVVLFLRLRLRAPARKTPPRDTLVHPLSGPESATYAKGNQLQPVNENPVCLVLLECGEGKVAPESIFNLPVHGTMLGSDPLRCDICLDAAAVSPLHAEVYPDAAGNFHIADRGSAAGTWVNYAPVSSQGTQLMHGDLVQIGSCCLRFEEPGGEDHPIQIEPYRG